MIVSIGMDEGLQIHLDDESENYSPDRLDDMCRRARELFRDTIADARAAEEQDL